MKENKNIIRQLVEKAIKEADIEQDGTKFTLRTGVNKNPTKLGIKVQFEPQEGFLDPDKQAALEVALQEKLNDSLKQYGIQVSKDTDVPRPEVIGFFIPLSQIKNLIVQGITGQKPEKPSVPAPEPGDRPRSKMPPRGDIDDSPPDDKGLDELKKTIKTQLNEMRVRDLNEASKIVIKEDFYNFINAGNNIIRTFEENGKTINEAKKYIKYLVAHNIM